MPCQAALRASRVSVGLTELEGGCLLEAAPGDVVGEGGSLPGWTGAEVAAYRRAVEKLAAALESARQPPAAGRQDASGPGRRPPVRHRSEPDERAAWRMSNVC